MNNYIACLTLANYDKQQTETGRQRQRAESEQGTRRLRDTTDERARQKPKEEMNKVARMVVMALGVGIICVICFIVKIMLMTRIWYNTPPEIPELGIGLTIFRGIILAYILLMVFLTGVTLFMAALKGELDYMEELKVKIIKLTKEVKGKEELKKK